MGVGEEEVFWLEVAVTDAAVVAVPDSGQQLPEVVPSGTFVCATVHLRSEGRVRFVAKGCDRVQRLVTKGSDPYRVQGCG